MIPLPGFNINNLMTGFSFLKDIIPKEQREQGLKAGFADFLSGDDEAAFMEAKIGLLNKKHKRIIEEWMSTDRNQGHLFRKYVATHPDTEKRIDILESYANERNHAIRTSRFNSEIIPPYFIDKTMEFFKEKKWYALIEYLNGSSDELIKASEILSKKTEDLSNLVEREKEEHLCLGRDKAGVSLAIHKFINYIWY
ncbi:hypothetical protein KAI92_04350 [Candidatus Parcubacteria bacterium]|nr:hypothetical protein [Candidatus Parcubacteria bacterium]